MNWAFKPYFLFNYLVFLIYPAFRIYQEYFNRHNSKFFQSASYQRENQLILSIMVLIGLKYFRYFTSFQQLTNEILFYSKLAFSILFFLYSYTFFFWYVVFILAVWFSVKLPKYDGPNKIVLITGEQRFTDLVLEKTFVNKKMDNFCFVVFFSELSDKCHFVSYFL